ncbi:MAG: hypothetical protein HYV07_13995 [Deltaproteobacteria bacterium]|nr:hypothetical protein [Deltaproteobacteria bacterium]
MLFDRRERGRRRADIEAAFDGRKNLDPDEFFAEHFSETPVPRDVSDRLRTIFEHVADTDLSLVRRHDRFSDELKFIWAYDSMADVEIVMSIEEEFRINLPGPVLDEAKTLRDLGCLVWARLNGQAGLTERP